MISGENVEGHEDTIEQPACQHKFAWLHDRLYTVIKLSGRSEPVAYSEQLWQEAKRRCRLNDEDVERAKRLGLNPRSLIKNISSKSEPWKAPVCVWLREMEAKRIQKTVRKMQRKEKREK